MHPAVSKVNYIPYDFSNSDSTCAAKWPAARRVSLICLVAHHPTGLGVCVSAAIRSFLLDADHEANNPADKALTAQLYGGNQDMRIAQEMVLGIGGVKALRAA